MTASDYGASNLIDSFEDGTVLDDWSSDETSVTATTNYSFDGSYSAYLYSNTDNGAYIERTLPGSSDVTALGFAFRYNSANDNNFRGFLSDANDNIIFRPYEYSGNFYINFGSSNSSTPSVSVNQNTWYFIEIYNIDYSAETFDWRIEDINGTVQGSGSVSFYTAGAGPAETVNFNNILASNGSSSSDDAWIDYVVQKPSLVTKPVFDESTVSPSDGATGVPPDPALSIDVSEGDGQDVDVQFFDASDDTQIGATQTVTGGSGTASVSSTVDYNTTFNWYAVGTDTDNNSTTSSTFEFTTTYVAETGEATNIQKNQVDLNGTLNTLTGQASLDVYFEYRAVGSSTWNSTSIQTKNSTGGFSETVTGLVEGQEYEFRAVATDGTDTYFGLTNTVTTSAPKSFEVSKGYFQTRGTNGDQTISDVGFEPDVVVFRVSASMTSFNDETQSVTDGYGWGLGMDDVNNSVRQGIFGGSGSGSMNGQGSESSNDYSLFCLELSNDGASILGRIQAYITSTSTDGFTLNYDSTSAQYYCMYEAYKFSNSGDYEIGTFSDPSSAGSVSVTTGFQPNFLMTFGSNRLDSLNQSISDGNNFGWSKGFAVDNTGTTIQQSLGFGFDSNNSNDHVYASDSNQVIKRVWNQSANSTVYGPVDASLQSWDSNGFTVNYSTVNPLEGSNHVNLYLAIKTANYSPELGTFQTPTTTGVENYGAPSGNKPVYLSFVGTTHIPSGTSSGYSGNNAADNHFQWMYGAAENTTDELGLGHAASSDSTNSHGWVSSTSEAVKMAYIDTNGNIRGREYANVSNIEETGFELDWSNVSSSGTYIAFNQVLTTWYGFSPSAVTVNLLESVNTNEVYNRSSDYLRSNSEIFSVNDVYSKSAGYVLNNSENLTGNEVVNTSTDYLRNYLETAGVLAGDEIVSRPDDTTTVVDGGGTGVVIRTNKDLQSLSASVSELTSNVSTAYLTDSNENIIDTVDVTGLSGDRFVFSNVNLSADTEYYIYLDNNGADYTIGYYDSGQDEIYSGRNLDILDGYYTLSGVVDGRVYSVNDLRGITASSAGVSPVGEFLRNQGEKFSTDEIFNRVSNYSRGPEEDMFVNDELEIAKLFFRVFSEDLTVSGNLSKFLSAFYTEDVGVAEVLDDNAGFITGSVDLNGSPAVADVYVVKSGTGQFKEFTQSDGNGDYQVGRFVDDETNTRYLVAVDFQIPQSSTVTRPDDDQTTTATTDSNEWGVKISVEEPVNSIDADISSNASGYTRALLRDSDLNLIATQDISSVPSGGTISFNESLPKGEYYVTMDAEGSSYTVGFTDASFPYRSVLVDLVTAYAEGVGDISSNVYNYDSVTVTVQDRTRYGGEKSIEVDF